MAAKICATAASLLASTTRPFYGFGGQASSAPLRRARAAWRWPKDRCRQDHGQNASMPKEPAFRAVARASNHVAAVMFRCPILRPRAWRRAPYRCRWVPGGPVPVPRAGSAPPRRGQTTGRQQIQHDGGAVLARLRERQACHGATIASNCETSQAFWL